MAKILERIWEWLFTIVYFMAILPIGILIQAVSTPIELVWNCIKHRRIIKPAEYWIAFADRMIDVFEDWVIELKDEL